MLSDVLKTATLGQRTVYICLDQSILGDLAMLNAHVKELEDASDGRTDPELIRTRKKIDEATRRLHEAALKFRVSALPFRRYYDLQLSCPPESEQDKKVGYNIVAFQRCAVEACTELDDGGFRKLSSEEWDQLTENMDTGAWESLVQNVLAVNITESKQTSVFLGSVFETMQG